MRGMCSVVVFLLLSMGCSTTALAQSPGLRKTADSLQKILSAAPDDTGKVMMLTRLSDMDGIGDCKAKLGYGEKALTLARKLNWESGIYNSLYQIADINKYCLKDNAAALNAYQQLEQIALDKNNREGLIQVYTDKASIYQLQGNYATAISYCDKIMQLNPRKDEILGTLGNKGQIYAELGNYPKALDAYEQSLKILNDTILADKRIPASYHMMQMMLLLNVADIYLQMRDYDKALANYNKALSGNSTLKDNDISVVANNGIGNWYILNNRSAESIPYFLDALAHAKNSIYEEEVLNNLANAYFEQKDIGKALTYATRAREAAMKHDNEPKLVWAYITLGKIENYRQQYSSASTYLLQAIAVAQKNGAMNDEKNAWQVLSETYSGMQQPQKAFEAYKQFIGLRDSIYNADKAKELTRLSMQGDFDRRQAADSIRQADEDKIAAFRLQRQRMMSYSGFAAVAVLLALAFLIYRNYSSAKRSNAIISAANETIKEEKQVSENLLLNILPEHVAEELKAKGGVDAKRFDDVTILFTDFVNFTTTAEKLTPEELVAELHYCFKAFDTIIGKYQIEKIKTIGDAYVAASGLPSPNDHHAADIINAAIEIRDFMAARKATMGDSSFGIRIGINSGSVVAGIVGIKKFSYDIWGDAVNIAARMEQKSEPGRINISETTYALVKDNFSCSFRGEIDAKNKGLMNMYFAEKIAAENPQVTVTSPS